MKEIVRIRRMFRRDAHFNDVLTLKPVIVDFESEFNVFFGRPKVRKIIRQLVDISGESQ